MVAILVVVFAVILLDGGPVDTLEEQTHEKEQKGNADNDLQYHSSIIICNRRRPHAKRRVGCLAPLRAERLETGPLQQGCTRMPKQSHRNCCDENRRNYMLS